MIKTEGLDESGPLPPTRINLVTGVMPLGLVAINLNGPGSSCGTLLTPRWRWTRRSIVRRAGSHPGASCIIRVSKRCAGRAES
jgi:hypothetical protein